MPVGPALGHTTRRSQQWRRRLFLLRRYVSAWPFLRCATAAPSMGRCCGPTRLAAASPLRLRCQRPRSALRFPSLLSLLLLLRPMVKREGVRAAISTASKELRPAFVSERWLRFTAPLCWAPQAPMRPFRIRPCPAPLRHRRQHFRMRGKPTPTVTAVSTRIAPHHPHRCLRNARRMQRQRPRCVFSLVPAAPSPQAQRSFPSKMSTQHCTSPSALARSRAPLLEARRQIRRVAQLRERE